MSEYSSSETAVSAMGARFRTIAETLKSTFWRGLVKQYRPEDHYMRGPGPKWSEKHGLNEEPQVSSKDRNF
jgi:hypothetical protein